MFDFIPAPVFAGIVGLSVPGQAAAWDVEFQFRHKGKKALAAWVDSWVGRGDEDILADVIEGWAVKRGGEHVPYTKTALAELLDAYPAAAKEIRDSYLRELTESKRKNS
jgi:hypothetical protein